MKQLTKIIFLLLYSVKVLAQPTCTNTSYPPCTTPWSNTDLFQIDRDLQNISKGTVSVNVTSGTVTSIAGGSITVTSGSVVITNTVPISGTVSITGGTISLTGTPTVVLSNDNVGGFTTKYTRTITTDGLYSSGDCVGGILTFTNLFRTSHTTGVLEDLEIFDANNQNANLQIDFYLTSPTSGTYTNNNPTVINDPLNYVGTVLVNSGDYITTGSKSRASINGIGLTIIGGEATTPRNFYAVITTTSTPTYGVNSTSLYLKLGVLQD